MAAIELGCPYYVSSGTQQFCLNNPNDPNFVGYVTDVTGLDDAEVRENAQNKVAGDGGLHGPFYKGRRPWTITGFVVPVMPVSARSAAQDFISQVMDGCLKADGYLTWYPTNSAARYIGFRKQQPVRITKGQSNVERTFQLSGVASDPLIYSSGPVHQADTGPGGTSVTVHNAGTVGTPPTITLYTIGVFTVTNQTTGQKIVALPSISPAWPWPFKAPPPPIGTLVIALGGSYPTVTNPSAVGSASDYAGYIDPIQTDWGFVLAPGDNTLTLTGANEMVVQWRDAWA